MDVIKAPAVSFNSNDNTFSPPLQEKELYSSANLAQSLTEVFRARINKGIIYPVRHSELDFTVPEFSGFIGRTDEFVQWNTEMK